MNFTLFIQQILHYATLPGVAGLFCVLVFMLDERKRGQLIMKSVSAAVSLALLLKELFRVPRPWLMHVENAPYLAEGGYAFPCLHTMLTAALLGAFALTSDKKVIRFLCALFIWIVAAFRVLRGLQSTADVLAGLFFGIVTAFLLCRFDNTSVNEKIRRTADGILLICGLTAAIICQNGWGLGLGLTAMLLEIPEKIFRKAESGRTNFGKIYGTIFAAGLYTGLTIFLPFLVEWLIDPLWLGQTLIVLLITLIPCLLRLFPLF